MPCRLVSFDTLKIRKKIVSISAMYSVRLSTVGHKCPSGKTTSKSKVDLRRARFKALTAFGSSYSNFDPSLMLKIDISRSIFKVTLLLLSKRRFKFS